MARIPGVAPGPAVRPGRVDRPERRAAQAEVLVVLAGQQIR